MTYDKQTATEAFNQLQLLNKQLSPKFERCAGISPSRLHLLMTLFEANEMSQTELQKQVGIDSAAITRHLKQLEASNMVTRRTNPDDNRITLVILTPQGHQQMETYSLEKQIFMNQLFSGFDPEDTQALTALLARLIQNIEKI